MHSVLTVGLLEFGTSTFTTEFLGFWSSAVGNQQGSVVSCEGLLQLVLGLLVHVFLVVSNQALGDGLSDGVHLGHMTTTRDSDSDVDVGELVQADQQQGLVDLESQDLWLHQGDRRTVDLDQTFAGLDVGNGSS